jgi:hypothetical protein
MLVDWCARFCSWIDSADAERFHPAIAVALPGTDVVLVCKPDRGVEGARVFADRELWRVRANAERVIRRTVARLLAANNHIVWLRNHRDPPLTPNRHAPESRQFIRLSD